MVVIAPTQETVSVIGHEVFESFMGEPFGDDIDGINEPIDWLVEAADDQVDMEALSRPWSPAADLLHDDDPLPMWSDATLTDAIDAFFAETDSGDSSPLDSPLDSPSNLFSANSSDSDSVIDGEISRPVKRKSTEMDEEADTAKKVRQMKKAARARVADDPTVKAIAQLRADGCGVDSRRRIHNVLERKRRNDLKDSYDELREAIPDMAAVERAPTGQILSKAVEFIAFLQREERALQAAVAAERAENERLRRVSGLAL